MCHYAGRFGTSLAPNYAMRLAIPIWNGRISPVFDVAGVLLVIDVRDGVEVGQEKVHLEGSAPTARVAQLANLGVDVLICGAISRDLDDMISSAGVNVISQTRGEADRVLRAFISGQLTEQAFLMPGCDGHRRQIPDVPGAEKKQR